MDLVAKHMAVAGELEVLQAQPPDRMPGKPGQGMTLAIQGSGGAGWRALQARGQGGKLHPYDVDEAIGLTADAASYLGTVPHGGTVAGGWAGEQQQVAQRQIHRIEAAGGPQAVFILGGQAKHMMLLQKIGKQARDGGHDSSKKQGR